MKIRKYKTCRIQSKHCEWWKSKRVFRFEAYKHCSGATQLENNRNLLEKKHHSKDSET